MIVIGLAAGGISLRAITPNFSVVRQILELVICSNEDLFQDCQPRPHHRIVWAFFMDKCIAQRIDMILKAAGAKGIGHYSRVERCRLLGLGEPKSNTEANKLLKAWLDQFDDRQDAR